MQVIRVPDWYYNEFQQVGLDFEKSEEVENYDNDYGSTSRCTFNYSI